MTAFHARVIQDLGSYQPDRGPMIPPLSAFVVERRLTTSPAVQTDVVGVFDEQVPDRRDPRRRAGRRRRTLIEVSIDQLADELGMDRLELRRRNFIAEFLRRTRRRSAWSTTPATTTARSTRCLELVDLDAVRAAGPSDRCRPRASTAASASRLYTEICGLRRRGVLGPGGLGLQGGWLGVGAGARPPHRQRDGLHRHLARTARAWRRASRRSSPTASGSTPTPSR